MNYKPIVKSELSQVCELEKELFGKDAFNIYVFRQFWDLAPDAFIGAFDGGKLLGYVMGAKTANTTEGWLMSVGGSKRHRAKGIGGKLLQKSLEALQAYGCTEILLTVSPKNKASKRMIAKNNFRLKQVEPDYFGKGNDREIYERVVR